MYAKLRGPDVLDFGRDMAFNLLFMLSIIGTVTVNYFESHYLLMLPFKS